MYIFYKPRESPKENHSFFFNYNQLDSTHAWVSIIWDVFLLVLKDPDCPLYNPLASPVRSLAKRTGQKQVPDLSFLTSVPKLAYLLLLSSGLNFPNLITFNQSYRIHGQYQMVSIEIRLIICFAATDGEALYSQQKQDQELIVAQIMNFLLPNTDWNWRK